MIQGEKTVLEPGRIFSFSANARFTVFFPILASTKIERISNRNQPYRQLSRRQWISPFDLRKETTEDGLGLSSGSVGIDAFCRSAATPSHNKLNEPCSSPVSLASSVTSRIPARSESCCQCRKVWTINAFVSGGPDSTSVVQAVSLVNPGFVEALSDSE